MIPRIKNRIFHVGDQGPLSTLRYRFSSEAQVPDDPTFHNHGNEVYLMALQECLDADGTSNFPNVQLNSGIEPSLRSGVKEQAASWEFTPCLSFIFSFYFLLSKDSPNKFFEASRVRLIYPVLLKLLILCVNLVWGNPYPSIIID
ncbi:hypothetical protein Tco_1314606 [Tanacetum coccineum]